MPLLSRQARQLRWRLVRLALRFVPQGEIEDAVSELPQGDVAYALSWLQGVYETQVPPGPPPVPRER